MNNAKKPIQPKKPIPAQSISSEQSTMDMSVDSNSKSGSISVNTSSQAMSSGPAAPVQNATAALTATGITPQNQEQPRAAQIQSRAAMAAAGN